MAQHKNPPLISGTQFVAIVVLTIAIFMVVDFGRRTTAGYYVSQAEKRLKEEIQYELDRKATLEARREYVASDAYVEEWAREEAHMIHDGDKPLLLVTPAVPATPEARERVEPVAASYTVPNWYHWWRLFFDVDPPRR